MRLSFTAVLRPIAKTTACLGTALALSALTACGGGSSDTVSSGGGGGGGGGGAPITSSSITLPTTVQVVSAH